MLMVWGMYGLKLKLKKECIDKAFKEQDRFKQDVREKGEEFLKYIEDHNEKAIVLAGRPYHLDKEVNHGIDTMINSLDYHEYTCDGIPEYKLTFPNGEVYYLNMSAKWVWIASSNVQYEATLTDEIINWLNTYGYPGLEPFEDLELSRNVQ